MRRWIALAWMVMTVSGCENVSWGGAEAVLEAPLPRAQLLPAPDQGTDPQATDQEPLPPLPEGPLLLAGTREGSTATLVVVGEIRPEGLAELPSEMGTESYRTRFQERLLPPGREFILFAEGIRVGRLLATDSGVDSTFCGPRPTVTGIVEVVPEAASAPRFLALPAEAVGETTRTGYRSYGDDAARRRASLSLASQAIATVSAPWPPSLSGSRADLQVFRFPEAEGEAIAATFLYQDQLEVEEPGARAYAIFVLGENDGETYRRSYTSYRRADDEGKGAPRYFGHVDWDGDGASEVLLDVFGAERRWFAGLDRQEGGWVRGFQDSCGSGSTAADQ